MCSETLIDHNNPHHLRAIAPYSLKVEKLIFWLGTFLLKLYFYTYVQAPGILLEI